MIKKRFFLILIAILIVFIGSLIDYRSGSERYNSILLFENYIVSPGDMYKEYNALYGEYPLSNKEICDSFKTEFSPPFDSISVLNDIKGFSKEYNQKIDWRWLYFYNNSIDPLSSNKNIFIYYPIYDRKTKKRENYLILSTGMDGHLNNTISTADTLYNDDWILKLKLYNKKHPLWTVDDNHFILNREEIIKYDFFKRHFGKKDYAIMTGTIN